MNRLSRRNALLAFALVGAAPSLARAGEFYWNTTATNSWSNAAAWSDSPTSGGTTGVVPTLLDTATFNQSTVNGVEVVQLDAPQAALGITFQNTGTTLVQSDSATARILTIGGSGVTINSGTGAVTLGNATNILNLSLNASQTWTNNASTALTVVNGVSLANAAAQTLTIGGTGNTTVGGVIGNGAGTLGLTKVGTGTLVLTGVNAYTGGTSVGAGGTLQIGNGTLNGSINGTSAVVNNGTLNILHSGTAQTLSAPISGRGNIQTSNTATGAITLSGANTFTGSVSIGTTATTNVMGMIVTGSSPLGPGFVGGPVSVSGNGTGATTGTFLQLGTGTTNSTVTGKTFVMNTGTYRSALTAGTSTGTNSWAGNIVLTGSGTGQLYNVTTGGTLTVGTSAAHTITLAPGSTAMLTVRGGSTTGSTLNSTLNTTTGLSRTDNTPWTFTSPYNVHGAMTSGNNQYIVGANNTFFPLTTLTTGGTTASTTFNLGAFAQTLAGLAIAGTNTTGTHTVTGTAGSVLTLNNPTNGTFGGIGTTAGAGGGIFANAVGVTKIGSADFTINSRVVNTSTGGLTANQGSLTLNFANLTTPTNLWNSGGSLTLGGGTFQVTAKASAATSQTLAGLTVNTGASAITLNNTVAGTPDTLLALGAITRPVTGGTVAFTLPGGTRSATNGITTSAANVNGILGGWATVGNDWATVDAGTGNTIAANAVYTDVASGTLASAAAANIRFTAAAAETITPAAPGTTDVHTLLQNGTGGTLTYQSAATDVLRVGAGGGVMVASGATALTLGDAANNGFLTAGGGADTAGSVSFWANSTTNPLTVNLTVANNGTGVVTVNKAGPGTLVLNGTNTYTGGTTIGGGVVTLGNSAALGNPNSTLALTGGTLNLNGNSVGVGVLTGFGGTIQSNVAGAVTLTIGNNNATSTSPYYGIVANGTGTVSLVKTGTGALILAGNNTYTGTTNVTGTLQIGADTGTGTLGTGAVTVNAASTLAFHRADAAYTVANVIGGDGGVSFIGRGAVTLTGANTYTGTTTISAGTLNLSGGNNRLPSGTTLAFNNTVAFASWLNLGSTNQTLRTMTFANVNTQSTITGTGTLTINGPTDLNIGGTVTTMTINVDMSGLSNFVFNSPANAFRVGTPSGSGTSATNINSVVRLAATNTITASLLAIQDLGLNDRAGNGILLLGTSNTLNVANVNFAYSNRSGGAFAFASGLTGATATFRNTDGTSAVSSFNVGRIGHVSAAATFNPSADFTGGSIDLLVNTMFIGDADALTNTGRTGTVNASFNFGAGTITATTINVGRINTGTGGSASTIVVYSGNGAFTVSGPGTLNVGTMNLATNTIATTGLLAGSGTSGTLNVQGGTIVATNIQVGAQTGTAPTVTAAFNWSGGTVRNTTGSNLTITGTGSVNLPITLLTTAAHTFDITAGQTGTVAASAPIGGDGGLTKTGAGTLVLSGPNTYTGGTAVNDGILRVNNSSGSGTGTGAVNVIAGGTIGGAGSIAGLLTIAASGTVSPGNSVGQLSATGGADWQGGGSYNWEIDNPALVAGTGWDLLEFGTSALKISATSGNKFTIQITQSGSASPSGAVNPDAWFTIAHAGSVVDSNNVPVDPGLLASLFSLPLSNIGEQWEIRLQDLGGGGGYNVQVSPVPEPGSVGMIGFAAVGLLARRSRRRNG